MGRMEDGELTGSSHVSDLFFFFKDAREYMLVLYISWPVASLKFV